jgi:serine/threonine-protein kinase
VTLLRALALVGCVALAGAAAGMADRDGRSDVVVRSLYGLARDGRGGFLLADGDGHRVVRTDARGRVSVVAGIGAAGSSGDGGPAKRARLSLPSALAVDRAGTIYVADLAAERIRRIDRRGTITTLARGIPGALHLVLARDGALLVTSSGARHGVRRIDPRTGKWRWFAGGRPEGSADGPRSRATFDAPHGLALGPDGDLYVADDGRIRRIDAASGAVGTIAGVGAEGSSGDGGPATDAVVDAIRLAVDRRGRVFGAEPGGGSNRVRMIDERGVITTVAGGPRTGLVPFDLLLEPDGKLLVTDDAGRRIVRLDPDSRALTTVVDVG